MDGWITIGTKLDTKSFDRQIEDVERKITEIENMLDKPKELGLSSTDIKDLEIELEKTKNKLIQLNTQKNKLGDSRSLDKLGKSFERAMKQAGRIALSIIGIRSALAMLRQASSELASYDEQYATDLEYIKFVLIQAIAPVLKGIVQLGMQLLQIVGMITQALFGVNIFANGSAENFQKMKAGASGTNKAVKELKKQLMGFDEVNVLTSQSDTGTSGGAGGVGIPSIDISQWQGEQPKWMDWLVDNKDALLSALAGIGSFIAGIKIADLLKGAGIIKELPLKTLGLIALGISGIVYAITNLIEYLDDPSWNNFGSIIQGVAVAIAGLAGAIVGLPAIIAGVVILIFGTIVKYWDKIRDYLQTEVDRIGMIGDTIRTLFGDTFGNVFDTFTNAFQDLLDIADSFFTSIKGQFDGLIGFITNAFAGDWDKAWNSLGEGLDAWVDGMKGTFGAIPQYLYDNNIAPILELFGGLWNDISSGFSEMGKGIEETFGGVGEFFETVWNEFAKEGKEAWRKIELVFSIVGNFFEKTFSDAWNRVVRVFNVGGEIFNNLRDGIVNSFTYIVNRIISGLNQVITIPFNNLNYVLRNLRNIDIMGIKPFGWVGTVSVPQIPYLKSGGIVNMPNRGTLVGSAFAGESGREGVIPLTDEQAMAELGREIGKHIVMNLTNITTLNGRRINREFRRLQSDNDFAYNY